MILSNVVFGQQKSDWEQLFNGKNLQNWNIKIAGRNLNDNYLKTFRVKDKMLRVVYDDYKNFDDKYGHLYYKTPYSHYILDYEYRFTGNQTPGGATWNVRNSGVMFHSQPAASLTFNQTFPVSLEMQLLGGLGNGERQTGNLCSPGTFVEIGNKIKMEHCINSISKTYDGDQWVKARLVVFGDSIVHQIIEGDTVLTYMKTKIGGGFTSKNDKSWDEAGFTEEAKIYWKNLDNTALKSGYIALQAESHPIDFKNIKLLNLKGCMDKKARNYKSYFKEPGACEY